MPNKQHELTYASERTMKPSALYTVRSGRTAWRRDRTISTRLGFRSDGIIGRPIGRTIGARLRVPIGRPDRSAARSARSDDRRPH